MSGLEAGELESEGELSDEMKAVAPLPAVEIRQLNDRLSVLREEWRGIYHARAERQAAVEQAAIDASKDERGTPKYGNTQQERKKFLERAVQRDAEWLALDKRMDAIWDEEGKIKRGLERIKEEEARRRNSLAERRMAFDREVFRQREHALRIREQMLRQAEQLIDRPEDFRLWLRAVILAHEEAPMSDEMADPAKGNDPLTK